jgi:hypothetical protein
MVDFATDLILLDHFAQDSGWLDVCGPADQDHERRQARRLQTSLLWRFGGRRVLPLPCYSKRPWLYLVPRAKLFHSVAKTIKNKKKSDTQAKSGLSFKKINDC